MPVEWMRQIDRWLGGLLVMGVSVLAGLRRRSPLPHRPGFGPNPPAGKGSQAPSTAPVLRKDPVMVVSKYLGMGSIVLTVPLLRAIRKAYPSAHIVFLSFSHNAGILSFLPHVDRCLTIRTGLLSFIGDTVRTLWRLWRMQADIFLDLEFFSRYSALMNFCSGAKTRVGFHTLSLSSRGRLLTHRVYWNPYRHALENFLSQGEMVGICPTERHLELRPLSPEAEKEGLNFLREEGLSPGRYIVCSPSADTLKALKSYPAQQWLKLAHHLHQRSGLHVICVGSKAAPAWDPLPLETQPHLHNLSGRTRFSTLLVVLQHAAHVVSVDSGVAHLAAALRVPTLVLFGPESPHLYGPLNPRGEILYANLHCSPCVNLLQGKLCDCRDNVCVNRWSPQEIAERVLGALGS